MSEPNLHQQMNEEARRIVREQNARRQLQYDYFDDEQWRHVSGGHKPIESALRLLYRLVRAVEDIGDRLDERL